MPPEFEIVKRPDGVFVGATQDDHAAYVKHLAKLDGMEAGEFLKLKATVPRSLPFHRRFMKMVRFAFEQWEPEKARKRLAYKGITISKSFERFRKDLLIQAGYGLAIYDSRGRVTMEAQSIAFDNMEEEPFREVYKAVFDVIYKKIFEAKGYTEDGLVGVLEEFERYSPT